MAITVEKLERVVASGGLIKLEESEQQGVYKLMRSGNVDSYLGHVTISELRDMFDVIGDLITFLDTEQPRGVDSPHHDYDNPNHHTTQSDA